MPNGANPAGNVGSWNVPCSTIGVNVLSYDSTTPELKFATSSTSFPPVSVTSAAPLYTAPVPELSTFNTAEGRLEYQPDIVPSSVTKRNELLMPFTLNPPAVLAATPVGVARFELSPGGGIVKVPCSAPVLSYSVALPLLLSAIQNGLPGMYAMPHGLIMFASVFGAVPCVSELRLVCL